jgi:hypothetical protein
VKRSAPPTAPLQKLLGNHFASNDFCSFCYFGRNGEDVSLELFNSLCILPSTKWNVSLNSDALGGIQASTMDSLVAQDHQLNKLLLATKNFTTLLMNVLKFHPESQFIFSYIPRDHLIPPPGPLPFWAFRELPQFLCSPHSQSFAGKSPYPLMLVF